MNRSSILVQTHYLKKSELSMGVKPHYLLLPLWVRQCVGQTTADAPLRVFDGIR